MAVQLFSADKRGEVAEANPGTSFAEMGKLLGAAWAEAGADAKAHYQELHAARAPSRCISISAAAATCMRRLLCMVAALQCPKCTRQMHR